MEKREYFAEVIESNLDNFLAQSWEWNYFPKFGSLVQVQSDQEIILGIVTQIQTGSMDPMRYPFAYKKTEEELLEEQPQIFEFLKTTFRVQICGFLPLCKAQIHYLLPSKPCKIHAFVKEVSQDLVCDFFSKPDFLHLLFAFSSQTCNFDELLLAIFRQLSDKRLLGSEKFDSFCQIFSLLTGNDYRRLKLFLKRVEVRF